MTTTRSITVMHEYAVPPETVFAAWVNAEQLRRWYAPVDGWVVGAATVEPGVGGGYDVTFGPAPSGEAYREQGTYGEYAAGERLAWTGMLDGDAQFLLAVDVTFASVDGGTLVTVDESGLRSNEDADDHADGWAASLRHLDELLG